MSDAEQTARAFVKRINERDLGGLVDLMTEDHAFIDDEGTVQRGRDVMREGWREYFRLFPEYKIHLSRVISVGEVVILIGRTTGSQVPREVEAEETVIWGAWVDSGLVREWHILYADADKARRLVGGGGT